MKIRKKRLFILIIITLAILIYLPSFIYFLNSNSIDKSKTMPIIEEVVAVEKEIIINETKFKDNGPDVEYIQNRLIEYGYEVTADGEFGWATYNAVLDFQYKTNLTLTGVANRETIDKLKNPPTLETMYIPTTPVEYTYIHSDINRFVNENDIISYSDYLLVTSLSNKMTYVFNGSMHNYELINTFTSTIGAPSTPTKTGIFRVGMRGTSFGKEDGFQAKYYTQFSGNFLYHSIIYDETGTKITDGRLGQALSHGCIRLSTENSKWIYENIPEYATVIVK